VSPPLPMVQRDRWPAPVADNPTTPGLSGRSDRPGPGNGENDLYAVCVGINHFDKVQGNEFGDLRCAVPDAREMSRVLRQHAQSKLYRKSKVVLINEADATAANISKQVRDVGSQAKPDDWFILFLSGHGHAPRANGSFYFVCADTDSANPATVLTIRELYDLLSNIRCGKLLILDTINSGNVPSNPMRDLTRDGAPFLIFSSCEGSQVSYEPIVGKGDNGLFTQCLLDELKTSAEAEGKRRTRLVTARELAEAVRSKLQMRLKELKVPERVWQTPVFLPRVQPDLPILCKP
jgi:uncharacterized caspase-like protein